MPIVLQYHKIRGLAAPARMMLTYGNVPFEDKYADTWFSGDKAEAQKTNALANLPIIYDTDGTVVTQSNAVYYYIGAKLGLNGDTPSEASRVDQILCEVMDLRNAAVNVSTRSARCFDRSHHPLPIALLS